MKVKIEKIGDCKHDGDFLHFVENGEVRYICAKCRIPVALNGNALPKIEKEPAHVHKWRDARWKEEPFDAMPLEFYEMKASDRPQGEICEGCGLTKIKGETKKEEVKKVKVAKDNVTPNSYDEDKDIEEPIEWAKVGAVATIALVVVAVLGVVVWVVIQHNHAVKVKECQNNPQLLHAQACVSPADCLNKCVAKLENGGGSNG